MPSGDQTEQVKPRLFLAGPLVGRNPGWPQSQGEVLADLLTASGFHVEMSSTSPGRLSRLTDTLTSLVRRRKDFDVLIVMVFSGRAFYMGEITTALGRFLGKPILLWLHGGNLPPFVAQHPRRADALLKRAATIVAPSGYLARMTDRATVTIPNIVDLRGYPFRQRARIRPRILWMRTFDPLYNPQMAVEVVSRLAARHPDMTLTMAGQDQGELSAVKSLVAAKHLEDRVRFVGFLDHEAKQREFEDHDLYLHTNRVDNMPVSLLEAAAFGLPIVASRVGGVPDVFVNELSALLVPEGDVEAMSLAVERLLDDAELSARLSTGARKVAEDSSWERVRPRWEDLLASLSPGGSAA
jgi:glycosyltransferase involved in cell wall biosynthesis